MADADDIASEGSDLELPSSDLDSESDADSDISNIVDIADGNGENGAVAADFQFLFASDSDSDDDFLGFQADWVYDRGNFVQQQAPAFNGVGGSAFQHPEEYSALDYFELLWDDQVGEKISRKKRDYSLLWLFLIEIKCSVLAVKSLHIKL